MRRGFGLVDVLLAIVVAAVVGIPVLGNVRTSVFQTAVSEDYMFAEVLARKVLAEALAVPLTDISKDLPYFESIGGVPERDAKRVAKLAAYGANLSGRESFRGVLVVDRVADDLHKYVVTIEWPVSTTSSAVRRLVLLRLRCSNDLSCRVRFADHADAHDRALGRKTR